MATSRTSRVGRGSRVLLGLAVSALFVWLLLRRGDVGAMLAEMRDVGLREVVLIAALLVAGHSARVLRWARLLQWTGARVHVRYCVSPYLIGISLNNLLPLRAGDVYRVVAFGERASIARTHLLGSIIIERLLDFMVLFTFLVGGIAALRDSSIRDSLLPWIGAVLATGATVTAALFVVTRVRARRQSATHVPGLRSPFLAPVFSLIDVLGQSLNLFGTPARVVSLVGLSVLAWAISIAIFAIAAIACGVTDYTRSSVLAAGAANLAGLLPSSPGSIGTFHYFAAWAYSAHDAPWNIAAAVAVVVHAMFWLPLTLIGLGVIGWRHLR